ncbi:MAG TPA: DPP IV N-terminal domain-containing protein [Gemmatimonadales bacterium]|nr:DPP IV N-terminal domain-containing protein [Gemmatimonadales bacterium]
MRLARVFGLLLAVLLLGFSASAAQQKARFANLGEALGSGGALNGGSGPRNVNWIDGGKRYSYTARGADGGEEIRAFDPATGKDTLLFTARGLAFPDTAEPFSYESFQWAEDSKHLVFQTRFSQLYRRSGTSDYYVYSLADHSLTLATRGARTAQLSPDGAALGLERDGDMYVYDFATRKETRLTHDATATAYNGHFDWVYEEEFGQAQAWNWSPDSRHLAYWQVDESAEPVMQFSDLDGSHPEYTKIRIPQPGDSNPTVRIGVVDVKSGKQVWLDPGIAGEYYIPRIYWTSRPDTLAMITLNRPQNEMRLFFFDVTTGGRRLVLTQKSDTWIDVYDFYAGVDDLMSFPAGVSQFLWLGDQDGWQHIYRYDYSGRLVNQVTRGKWSVTRIEGVDPKTQTIYYTGTQASPLERQLYSIRFDGSHPARLTATAGTHHINMSPDTRFYIDRWGSVSQPRQVELWATGGKMLKKLEDNARVTQWLATHEYSPTELFSFTTTDSVRLDGSLIKPPGFDSTRRYPVIFAIYGGPGSQEVYDDWGGSTLAQWLAQEGYIVVGLNNRGSNNYGSAFMKVVYKHLGKWEAHDFAEAARWLAKKPWVDGQHIAIMGTSYGGYSTVYAMEAYPDVFSVGVANSAVTDWRLYDTIYTERYMGLLGDNLAGYDSSSGIKNAARLTGHILIIHSLMDDNVHPQNTMQLLTALANAGHDAEVRMYPPGRHGAAYNQQSFLLLERASDDFLGRFLKGTH